MTLSSCHCFFICNAWCVALQYPAGCHRDWNTMSHWGNQWTPNICHVIYDVMAIKEKGSRCHHTINMISFQEEIDCKPKLNCNLSLKGATISFTTDCLVNTNWQAMCLLIQLWFGMCHEIVHHLSHVTKTSVRQWMIKLNTLTAIPPQHILHIYDVLFLGVTYPHEMAFLLSKDILEDIFGFYRSSRGRPFGHTTV